ncbi:MAG: hypothetical protein M1838_001300 [Thelocarpon superellum]|nr:MAG: hypothetical protein M1838_001300 [Thelocarpon superellum]
MTTRVDCITVGVLALQGAFREHVDLLRVAAKTLQAQHQSKSEWQFTEVRNAGELARCDALIIPGGESTTMALVASRSNFLEPLREFVKVRRKPTWGTCAGLILLAESANRTKKGGQDLIGGLDVRVNRNHFGRQTESFEAKLDLPFLTQGLDGAAEVDGTPFRAIFIRAPVVEKILPTIVGPHSDEEQRADTVIAPSRTAEEASAGEHVGAAVEVMATLGMRTGTMPTPATSGGPDQSAGNIIAVRQGNVFGTSFHPELTGDARIHIWWLRGVEAAILKRRETAPPP